MSVFPEGNQQVKYREVRKECSRSSVGFLTCSPGSPESLKNLTDHGQKDKETDRLDSVMSSDDCNMAIRAGSLEEEAHEPQAWKVWGASEQTRMGCTWISLYQPVL